MSAGPPRPGSIIWNTTVDIGGDIWYDSASSIYITGYRNNPGLEDVTVEKWNTIGSPIWSRVWDGGASDVPEAISGDTEGNVYVCGETNSFGIGDTDLLLLKYAANGTLLWNRTYGSHAHITRNEVGVDVVCDSQGNIYTCGSMVPSNGANDDMLLIKWASNGTQLWSHTYGGTNHEVGIALTLTPSGEIYFFGQYYLPSPTYVYTVVTKWDGNGNLAWGKTSTTSGYYEACQGASSLNSSMLYTNSQRRVSGEYQDIDVSRWYPNGTRQWYSTWGQSFDDVTTDIIVVSTGEILVSGYSEMSTTEGDNEGILVKMDPNGDIAWNVTWQDLGISAFFRMQEMNSESILVTYGTNPGIFLANINITTINLQYMDSDNDGITDYNEIYIYGTDPHDADTDGDGLGDWSELFMYNTDPMLIDTDGDGASDTEEVNGGTNPLDPADNPTSKTITTVALAAGIPAGAAVAITLAIKAKKKKQGRQAPL